MKIQKPLLAGKFDSGKAKFPYAATPKIDGIRFLIVGGAALTRSFKPIRNEYLQKILSSFTKSCYKMNVIVNKKEKELKKKREKKGKDTATLTLIYAMEEYQEIKNEREFGLEMLFSSIGGFVGMFIGSGLLQVLDYGLDCALSCKRVITRKGN